MKADAHYYAVLAFARACGFTKEVAHKVAFASQFVDDATVNLIYIHGDVEDARHDVINGKACFFNMATCHSYERMGTFNYAAMINNTTAFHFVPGCQGKVFTQKLRCREESPVIKKIMKDAVKESDPVKLGIALHAFADTFSHQGFSGLLSSINDIRKLDAESGMPWELTDQIAKLIRFFTGKKKSKFDRLVDSALPAYAHAQALEYPDLPYAAWSYQYEKNEGMDDYSSPSGKINNKERYRRAFEKIREHLDAYLARNPHCADPSVTFKNFSALYRALIAFKTDSGREKNWRKVMINENLFSADDMEYLVYDRHRWMRKAFSNYDKKRFCARTVKEVTLNNGFSVSDWYRFYRAVQWYKEKFFHYCESEKLHIPM